MSNPNSFSRKITVFHGKLSPEPGLLVGYAAIIEALKLPVPPPRRLSLISTKHKQYSNNDWMVFTPRHQPDETLYGHLVFAIKYEGINLLFFKNFFLFPNILPLFFRTLGKNYALSGEELQM